VIKEMESFRALSYLGPGYAKSADQLEADIKGA
jgi:hypothetical protein